MSGYSMLENWIESEIAGFFETVLRSRNAQDCSITCENGLQPAGVELENDLEASYGEECCLTEEICAKAVLR